MFNVLATYSQQNWQTKQFENFCTTLSHLKSNAPPPILCTKCIQRPLCMRNEAWRYLDKWGWWTSTNFPLKLSQFNRSHWVFRVALFLFEFFHFSYFEKNKADFGWQTKPMMIEIWFSFSKYSNISVNISFDDFFFWFILRLNRQSHSTNLRMIMILKLCHWRHQSNCTKTGARDSGWTFPSWNADYKCSKPK